MSRKDLLASGLPPLFLVLLLLLPVASRTQAAAEMEELLPPVSCGVGWRIEAQPVFYNRETLSDRIDGEAELYLPYGFDRLAAARYASEKSPAVGMDVEIYRMGSPLDAFGMFANYRQKDGRSLEVGADSNLSGLQLFLYQGRYFVHIQITGADAVDQDALAGCGKVVAARMTGPTSRPPELAPFDRPEVTRGTERYLPQSLLGYDFLNRGIMADAVVDGSNLQIFVLLDTTARSAAEAFDGYRSQLLRGTMEAAGTGATFLEGSDPLYGPVIILKKGNCLAGALKYSGKKAVRVLLEGVCR
jgi:hypothetical protein